MQVTFAPTTAGDFGNQISIAVNEPDAVSHQADRHGDRRRGERR